MFAIIGTLVVLGSVLGGFAMGGSSLLLLWHPLEVVVICGAALGAFMISNPMKVIKASFSGALGLVKGARYGRAEYIQLLKLVYDILVMARKDGVLAIERHIEDPSKSDIFKKYPFITGRPPHDGVHHRLPAPDLRRQPRSARAGEPARVRARDPSQGVGRALACRAEGGRRAAGLRHRGRGARHRQHHGRHRWREHRRDRPQGGRGTGGYLPRHPGGLRLRRPDRRRPWSTRRTRNARPSKW